MSSKEVKKRQSGMLKPIDFVWTEYERKYPLQRIPFGFKTEQRGDKFFFVPDPEIIPTYEKALEYVNGGGSLRDATNWLNKQLGTSVTFVTVSKQWHKQVGSDKHNARVKKLAEQKKRLQSEKTPEQKELDEILHKRKIAKRTVKHWEKKLQEKGIETDVTTYKEAYKGLPSEENTKASNDARTESAELSSETKQEVTKAPEEYTPPEGMPTVAFRPNPGPQTDFLAAPEQEVLYGGAAGGGKSYALLADPARYFENKNFNGLLLRRTNDELRELKWKSKELYTQIYPKAKWSEKDSTWTFPSGARLWMSYLERDEDVLRYQGQAFTWIGIDELTQYATPFAWNYLRSRLRSTDPTIPLSQRGTTNPGGPGHGWVKAMFVDPAPPNTSFVATDLETGGPMVYPEGHEKAGKPLFRRRFIPASLYDNPYLMADGSYEASLLSLPEQHRRQLLEGDWNIADGAAFPEFRVKDHVIKSSEFEIPHTWKRFRSCDYGYSSYSCVHWYAIDPAFETLIVYRELYVSKHTGRDLARKILELEAGESISYGILDSSVWHQRGQVGPSIAEEMIAEGCRWRPADRSSGSRTAGKNRLHELLKVNEDTGKSGIQFFDTCRQIISDLGVIPVSPKGHEDIDDRYASDHAYDSIRYGIMSRPKSKSIFEEVGMSPSWTPADSRFGY